VTGAERRVVVFVKAPRPGTVKTRLAETIGAPAAAELYRRLAEAEIAGTAPHSAADFERLLCYAPADGRAEVEASFPGIPLVAQSDGDLGGRMLRAFQHAFDQGARRVALIGTDVPWVTRAHLMDALDRLDDVDVVLGPTTDGGYYLIALKRAHEDLFRDVAWSTAAVLPTTVERCHERRLRVFLLEELPDIDTLDDVARHWVRLEPLLDARPAVLQALRRADPKP
jgi:rSAM/selenodomain-associated transferase 1